MSVSNYVTRELMYVYVVVAWRGPLLVPQSWGCWSPFVLRPY